MREERNPRLPRFILQQLGGQHFRNSELKRAGAALAQTKSQFVVLQQSDSTRLGPSERFQDLHIRHSDLKYKMMRKYHSKCGVRGIKCFHPVRTIHIHRKYVLIICISDREASRLDILPSIQQFCTGRLSFLSRIFHRYPLPLFLSTLEIFHKCSRS